MSRRSDLSSRHVAIVGVMMLTLVGAIVIMINLFPVHTQSPTYENGYRDGFIRARALASEVTNLFHKTHPIISGTITDISDDRIQFNATGLIIDKIIDGVGVTRSARLTETTKLISMQSVPEEVYKKQVDEFDRYVLTHPEEAAGLTRPSRMIEQPIELSDLHVGDSISVQGTQGQDLFFTDSFEAGLVILHPAHGAATSTRGE